MNHEETAYGLEREAFDLREGAGKGPDPYFRRNFTAHTVEGGLYMAGLTFTAAETVLPALVSSLGGAMWMVSLSSVLAMVGVSLPSLFVAHLLERLPWKKPVLLVGGIFQRLPFLVSGLCLLFLAESHPVLTLCVVAISPFATGVICGLTFTAWMELVAKTIPGNRMSSLFAARLVIAAVAGFFGGAVVAAILSRLPGSSGYGVLYLITSGFLFASWIVFLWIKEPFLPPRRAAAGLRESLSGMTAIIRADRNFVLYLLSRISAGGALIALPFMALWAIEILQTGDGVLGYLIMAMVSGALAGNLFAGYAGDRFGAKVPMVAATALHVAPFLLAAFGASLWCFLLSFFLLGFCRDAVNVASGVLSVELAPAEDRIRYLSLMSASVAPSLLAASGIGMFSWWVSGSFLLPAMLSAASMLVSLAFALRIHEPRHRSRKLRHSVSA